MQKVIILRGKLDNPKLYKDIDVEAEIIVNREGHLEVYIDGAIRGTYNTTIDLLTAWSVVEVRDVTIYKYVGIRFGNPCQHKQFMNIETMPHGTIHIYIKDGDTMRFDNMEEVFMDVFDSITLIKEHRR